MSDKRDRYVLPYVRKFVPMQMRNCLYYTSALFVVNLGSLHPCEGASFGYDRLLRETTLRMVFGRYFVFNNNTNHNELRYPF